MAKEIMYDRFKLEIKLGNDGMQSGTDVIRALLQVVDKMGNKFQASGKIVDDNGNTVGSYGPYNA